MEAIYNYYIRIANGEMKYQCVVFGGPIANLHCELMAALNQLLNRLIVELLQFLTMSIKGVNIWQTGAALYGIFKLTSSVPMLVFTAVRGMGVAVEGVWNLSLRLVMMCLH